MIKKITITDKWGDIKKKDVSVIDLIKEKLEQTFDIKEGKNPFRRQLNDMFEYELRKKVEEIIAEVRKEMQEKIETETSEQIRKKIFEK